MLGHAHPGVVDAVSAALANGSMPAFNHPLEEQAARAIARHTGHLDRVVFTNSGSEAVHLACRIARHKTGRDKIVKIAAGFDGWFDEVAYGNSGSRDAMMDRNTRPERDRTILTRWNDIADIESLFAERSDIAAVIFEPLLANSGCIEPAPGYLQRLCEVAHSHGAMVIADEVLMGFRCRLGLASAWLGEAVDIATVGKAIGSGIPVAGVLGTSDSMADLESGAVVRAGTYSGNPVATAAVVATIGALETVDYPGLLVRGDRLRTAISRAFSGQGLNVSTTGHGTVFTLWASENPPRDYREAAEMADMDWTVALHKRVRELGCLIMPNPFGRIYITFAHSDDVCNDIAAIFADAAMQIARAA